MALRLSMIFWGGRRRAPELCDLAPQGESAPLELADGKLAATLTRGGALPASVRVTAIPLDPFGREGHPLFVQAPLA